MKPELTPGGALRTMPLAAASTRLTKLLTMTMPALPKTDLSALRDEVLRLGPRFALPSRLSAHWLDLIARDLDLCFGNSESGPVGGSMAGPLALVLNLLFGKSGSAELKITLQEAETLLRVYQMEVAVCQVPPDRLLRLIKLDEL